MEERGSWEAAWEAAGGWEPRVAVAVDCYLSRSVQHVALALSLPALGAGAGGVPAPCPPWLADGQGQRKDPGALPPASAAGRAGV